MIGGTGMGPARLRLSDDSITRQKVRKGTLRRVIPFVRRFRWAILLMLLTTVVDAIIAAANPLALRMVIDDGIVPGRLHVVLQLSLGIAGLAVVDAAAIWVQTLLSGRIGEGLVYELRTKVFDHVQRQPLAFFTRAQTGALVSRLNTDIVGAQQAVTTLLSQTLTTVLTVALVLGAMFLLSWQIALASVVMIPLLLLLPVKFIGRRLQRLTRQGMQLNAEMGSMMNERFNVSGAMLAKLYGRPEDESALFAGQAARVRDITVSGVVYGRMFFIIATLLTSLTSAMVYGLGGVLAIDGTLKIGTLVAMVTLLLRLYGPVNQLSSVPINVMTALVSFDRIFEVLDLQPLIKERLGAPDLALPDNDGGTAPEIEFDKVSFRYPGSDEVSIASLEALPQVDSKGGEERWTLKELSFVAPAGKLTALVGPSGAGKTTLSQLVPRLYDPTSGVVRIAGQDLREVSLASLRQTIGVVTQDAHLFHDTIRANLLYARPDADEDELVTACRGARMWDAIAALPDGLDTVVGDRGYRLSGGEKQRLALARLLLKSPPVVVLDEATAHLDSESEAAIQRALKTALADRTSLVIAHRLSTIREADQILVVDDGRICERGTHEELLARRGVYADLYLTQFAGKEATASA
ncbi:ABC transporter [Streptomyces canus]|uniref:ABC transporter n=1 Tax=Streptomyces canus TaxID=58343 RepID=A0A101RMP0_9ACTN|nr:MULTISPECIES: ABC transporter ATP-binding protein [Streptomyces]KUN58401.1 ABC transporter [Streptomyces canus]MDI5907103.1 ABC transporter ATP-binding protein [Streptomyces sp. 12257]